MPFHAAYTGDDIHVPYAFLYADESERTGASGLAAADVGKFARQSDDNSVWMLTATTPTWLEISAHSFSAPSIYSEDGTIGEDRTVTLEGNLDVTPDTDGDHDVDFGTNTFTDRINSFNVRTQDGFGASAGSQNDRSFIQLFGDTLKGLQLGYFLNEASQMGFNINVGDDGDFEVIDAINSKGLVYAGDYSAAWTARSLVDKAYVDGLTGAGSIYSVDGTLDEDRVVTLANFDLEFRTEIANRHFYVWAANGDDSSYSQRSQLSIDHNGILLSDAQASGGAENTLQSISISPSGIVFTDLLNVRGVTYAADYSGAYTARSLVDRGYIDGLTLDDISGDIAGDASIYLDGDDVVIYHGSSGGSPAAIMTFHGDKTGALGSSRITLHDGGMFVSNETHVNFGKGSYAYWNDGTQTTTTFGLGSILNASDVFQYMESNFFQVRHIYNDLRDFEWYFAGDTSNDQWRIFDSSDEEILSFTRNGHLTIAGYFQIGTDNTFRIGTGLTADDQWRFDGGDSNDNFRLIYRDDSAATSDVRLTVTPQGNVTIDGVMSALSVDLRPYQVSGTGVDITTTEALLDLSTIDIANASYYTLASDVITFIEAGVYLISTSLFITDDDSTGGARGHVDAYWKNGTTVLANSHGGSYVRETSEGANACWSFLVEVAADDDLSLFGIGENPGTGLPNISQGATQVSVLKVGPPSS